VCRFHRYKLRVSLYRDGRKKEYASRLVQARTIHDARMIGEDWAVRLVMDCLDGLGEWTYRVQVVTL
jgi:hypothetical protein